MVFTLPASVFIRRFLLHILPKGMQKIRFCRWMGRNVRRANLHGIRQSIGAPPPKREELEASPLRMAFCAQAWGCGCPPLFGIC